MGELIKDEESKEAGGSIEGLALLPVETVFKDEKITCQVSGKSLHLPPPFDGMSSVPVYGYEIHMGRSRIRDGAENAFPLAEVNITSNNGTETISHTDGCVRGKCIGTYLHGIFDDPGFRTAMIGMLYADKGLERKKGNPVSYKQLREERFDSLADVMRANMDMRAVYGMIGKE